ncbi:MAG: 23S rRNA (pseudouridine(1915)-N(3))-methyltransferase RlmH [Oscillospiraceae bacterium]|nr:23S rRNA (pseudouridine(1915)-N(3))-methyltransferase RlmH [Oscillospiraceae bacterium]
MLTITILAVGRLKDEWLQEAVREYTKRAGAYFKLSVEQISGAKLPQKPSGAQISAALEREADEILAKIPPRTWVAAMCVEGESLSSAQLAQKLERISAGASHAVFVIGGSHGLSERVKARANLRLSMSAMTFSHRIARVMLCEQLYRAGSINAGGKYHK